MQDKQVIHKARALYYNLFANFFVIPEDMNGYLALRGLVDVLKESPLDTESGKALENLYTLLDSTSNAKLSQEFDDMFHNPTTKKVRQTASFYDEGLESGKKRLEMVNFVAKTKFRRNEQEFFEYEDSIGFILSLMAELSELISNGEENYENTAHCIFAQILNEFVDQFAAEIYEHESAVIYKELMVVLHSFVAFERMFLDVTKPKPKAKVEKLPTHEEDVDISEEEKARRARNKELKKLGPKQDESCPVDIAYDVETDI